MVNDSENHQSLLYGMGDQHLDIVVSRLLNEYKVEIELSQPKVAFRETIRKKSDVEYKYKKQTGGHGQYGHVKMKFEPSGDLEKPYEFAQEVVGGAVPKNYYPAVEKGIQESVQKGPLAAYPVVGVKAILYDGSYHPVDSSEMAFKMATIQAFKKGFMDAGPVLLEPIASLKAVSYTHLDVYKRQAYEMSCTGRRKRRQALAVVQEKLSEAVYQHPEGSFHFSGDDCQEYSLLR